MPKYMPKDQVDDPTTMKRKNDNYLAKKHNRGDSAGTIKQQTNDGDLAAKADKALEISNDASSGSANKSRSQEDQRIALPAPNIPFKTQRRVLTTLQTWLEEACFQFFQRWTPGTLIDKGLKDAEQVELTEWSKIIGKEIKTLPKDATQRIPGTSLTQELTALHHLTDAAVHRQPVTVARLLDIISAASNLMTMMKDDRKISLIETLETNIQNSVRICEERQEDLKSRLSYDLKDIDSKKAAYYSIEKGCIENARRVHEGYQDMVGAMLNNFLDGKPNAPVQPDIPRLPVFEVRSERQEGLQQSVAPLGVRIFGRYTSVSNVSGEHSKGVDTSVSSGLRPKHPLPSKVQGVAPFGKPDCVMDSTGSHPIPTNIPEAHEYNEDFKAKDGNPGEKPFGFTFQGDLAGNSSQPDRNQTTFPARPETILAGTSTKPEPFTTVSVEPAVSSGIWGRARDVQLTGQLLSPSTKADAAPGDPVKKETPPKDKPVFGQFVFSFPKTPTPNSGVAQQQQVYPEASQWTSRPVSQAAGSTSNSPEFKPRQTPFSFTASLPTASANATATSSPKSLANSPKSQVSGKTFSTPPATPSRERS